MLSMVLKMSLFGSCYLIFVLLFYTLFIMSPYGKVNSCLFREMVMVDNERRVVDKLIYAVMYHSQYVTIFVCLLLMLTTERVFIIKYIESVNGNVFSLVSTAIITPVSIFVSYKLGKNQALTEKQLDTILEFKEICKKNNSEESFLEITNMVEKKKIIAQCLYKDTNIDELKVTNTLVYMLFSKKRLWKHILELDLGLKLRELESSLKINEIIDNDDEIINELINYNEKVNIKEVLYDDVKKIIIKRTVDELLDTILLYEKYFNV